MLSSPGNQTESREFSCKPCYKGITVGRPGVRGATWGPGAAHLRRMGLGQELSPLFAAAAPLA